MSFERSVVRSLEKYTFPTGSFWLTSLGLPPIRWIRPIGLHSLQNMRQTTKSIETGHLIGFLGISLYSSTIALQGETMNALAVTGLNVIGNLPPIFLNRHNRTRIDHAIARREKLDLISRLKNFAWSQPRLTVPKTQEEIDDLVFEIILRETKIQLSLAA